MELFGCERGMIECGCSGEGMRKPSGKSNTTLQMGLLILVCGAGGLAYWCSGLKPMLRHQEGLSEDINQTLGLCYKLGEKVVLSRKVNNAGGAFKGLRLVVSGSALKLLDLPSTSQSSVVIGANTFHPNFVSKADSFEAELQEVDVPLFGQFSYLLTMPSKIDGSGGIAVNVMPLKDASSGDLQVFGNLQILSNRPPLRMEDLKIIPMPIPYNRN